MDMSVALQAVALKQAQTQQTAQMLMTKKNHEMEQQLVDMITQSAENLKAMPAPGTGARVDKSA
ncbi:putative motility protein [Cucumibacter marinus]|jgi:hypothetical protein|uniref:putative motility protein n=1 Tax=Cucumibacter marinus TaxID=1121252 RepID=UPI000405997A|nr:putative motility protein [Cucumibacter marinus]